LVNRPPPGMTSARACPSVITGAKSSRAEQALALLVWGPAGYALKDRDRWISWSVHQRRERLQSPSARSLKLLAIS
jgi:hypothetical protein